MNNETFQGLVDRLLHDATDQNFKEAVYIAMKLAYNLALINVLDTGNAAYAKTHAAIFSEDMWFENNFVDELDKLRIE